MSRTYTLTEQGRALRSAQKDRSRRALIEAARALFGERGFDGVSVTDIGRRAGVSHTLINTYFGGKAGLLCALVEAANAPQLDQTAAVAGEGGPAVPRLRRILGIWAEGDLEDPRVLQVLQAHSWLWSDEDEARNRVSRQAFKAHVARVIDEGRAGGELPPGAPSREISTALFAIYTWGMREAIFSRLGPGEAVARLWPQICALIGLGAPYEG
jgi:AcrR family transcriptional regulator